MKHLLEVHSGKSARLSYENREGERLYYLSELAEMYDLLLIDTCALLSPLHKRAEILSLSDKIEIRRIAAESARFFMDFVERDGELFVTRRILKECEPFFRGNLEQKICSSQKREKFLESPIEDDEDDGHYLRRMNRKKGYEKNGLCAMFSKIGNIVSLEQNKFYKHLRKKYSSLASWYGVHKTDFDFFVSGAVLSSNGPVALISNDIPILNLWSYFLKIEGGDSSDFGFFVRREFDGFSEKNCSLNKRNF